MTVIYRLPDCPGCGRAVGALDPECTSCRMPAAQMAAVREHKAKGVAAQLQADALRRKRSAEFAAAVNGKNGMTPRRPTPEVRVPQPQRRRGGKQP